MSSQRPVPTAVLRTALAVTALAASMLLAGCTGDAPPAERSEAPTSTEAQGAASDHAGDTADADAPPAEGAAQSGPEAAFRAWLAASRAPEPSVACGYLTDALAERMVAEMVAQGWPGVTDCESMIGATAELYAAVGATAEVSIDVLAEDAGTAELFVHYADGGDCGSASMLRESGGWVITEQSQEEC